MRLLLVQGDACHLPLEDASVDTIVCSPPYYGLRVYNGLEHTVWPAGEFQPYPGAPPFTLSAWAGCVGNEDTIEAYLWHSVLWLRECWRVLKETGVVWVVIGDSYATNIHTGSAVLNHDWHSLNALQGTRAPAIPGGNLLLIPARFALAAQADGWVLRQEVVWAKPAPLPESVAGWRYAQRPCACVTARRAPPQQGSAQQNSHILHDHSGDIRDRLDGYGQPDPACPTCHGTGHLNETVLRTGSWRHTRATESIFMLTKGMGYFCDGEAVKEAAIEHTHAPQQSKYQALIESLGHKNDGSWQRWQPTGTRNPRNVVSPPPAHFAGAHFATFPTNLITPLIRAACPERVCVQCGRPWAPIVTSHSQQRPTQWTGAGRQNGCPVGGGHVGCTGRGERHSTVHGLAPTCCCNAPHRPGVVLDPFCGSGATLEAARALGRHAIGVERSSAYLPLARERLGLAAMAAWEGHHGQQPVTTYHDLPLFAGGTL